MPLIQTFLPMSAQSRSGPGMFHGSGCGFRFDGRGCGGSLGVALGLGRTAAAAAASASAWIRAFSDSIRSFDAGHRVGQQGIRLGQGGPHLVDFRARERGEWEGCGAAGDQGGEASWERAASSRCTVSPSSWGWSSTARESAITASDSEEASAVAAASAASWAEQGARRGGRVGAGLSGPRGILGGLDGLVVGVLRGAGGVTARPRPRSPPPRAALRRRAPSPTSPVSCPVTTAPRGTRASSSAMAS